MTKDKEIVYSDFMMYDTWEWLSVKVILGDETVWMTQDWMAELFYVDRTVVTKHIKNIYSEWELDEKSTCAKIAQVQKEGNREVKREILYYNLDAILSVGYRVTSKQATKFRIRATNVLRNFLIKWYSLDKERLKQWNEYFWKDYFQELLEEIREIRASERMFYRKITDIFALSEDYDPSSELAQEFFSTVQNKLHYAIHQHTSAEIISERADHKKPNMGLTSWKNQKNGWKVLSSDVNVAKNYLSVEEIKEMNAITSMLLDFAENMARKRKIMKMSDRVIKVDEFLKFNEYPILDNPWSISSNSAKAIAKKEFASFRVIQDREYVSDFDEFVEKARNLHDIENDVDLSEFNKKLKKWLEYNPNTSSESKQ